MANFFRDNQDLAFYLHQGIAWGKLLDVLEPHLGKDPQAPQSLQEALETYEHILDMVGTFVADEIAPHVVAIDKEGMRIEDGQVIAPKAHRDIFEHIKALDLHGLPLPRDIGGLNAPMIIYFIISELLARADVSIMTHHGFHSAIAMALLVYSITEGSTSFDSQGNITSTRFEKEIKEIIAGEAWGCMDITEPNAGSDMAALACKAEQDKNGQWFITGQKIFITSGHGKYHVVIARTEPLETGLQGLSLFLVPAYEKNSDGSIHRFVTVDRLEEKLGHHASATCAISFQKSPAKLIGKRGEGFKHMLLLMNNARLGVGFEGLGLCEAAYRLAKNYCDERKSMGKVLSQHEIIFNYLDEMETDIVGIRALAMEAAFHEEYAYRIRYNQAANQHPAGKSQEQWLKEEKRAAARSRKLTPLVKFLAAEKGVEMARKSIQMLGGVGYTTEYGAEKLLRDSLVMPIYEGTTQIQALMVLKDSLSVVIKNPKKFIQDLAQTKIDSLSARDPLRRRVAHMQYLVLSAIQKLLSRTAGEKLRDLGKRPMKLWAESLLQKWDPKKDFSYGFLHAEHLSQMIADTAIVEILYEQSQKFPERQDLFLGYLERAELRCQHMHEVIHQQGSRLLKKLHREEPSEKAPKKV